MIIIWFRFTCGEGTRHGKGFRSFAQVPVYFKIHFLKRYKCATVYPAEPRQGTQLFTLIYTNSSKPANIPYVALSIKFFPYFVLSLANRFFFVLNFVTFPTFQPISIYVNVAILLLISISPLSSLFCSLVRNIPYFVLGTNAFPIFHIVLQTAHILFLNQRYSLFCTDHQFISYSAFKVKNRPYFDLKLAIFPSLHTASVSSPILQLVL